MDIQTITIPEGKAISLDGERYRLAESVDVPASALGEKLKKQATKMRPFGCPVCGMRARATAKYKEAILRMVCSGPGTNEHEPTFLVWLDDEEGGEEGEE